MAKPTPTDPPEDVPLATARALAHRKVDALYLRLAITKSSGDLDKAADLLGIGRRQLARLRAEHPDVDPPRGPGGRPIT